MRVCVCREGGKGATYIRYDLLLCESVIIFLFYLWENIVRTCEHFYLVLLAPKFIPM